MLIGGEATTGDDDAVKQLTTKVCHSHPIRTDSPPDPRESDGISPTSQIENMAIKLQDVGAEVDDIKAQRDVACMELAAHKKVLRDFDVSSQAICRCLCSRGLFLRDWLR